MYVITKNNGISSIDALQGKTSANSMSFVVDICDLWVISVRYFLQGIGYVQQMVIQLDLEEKALWGSSQTIGSN